MIGTAASLYGSFGSPQPTGTTGPASAESQLAAVPGAQSAPSQASAGTFAQPLFWLVVLVAVAIGLVAFSVRVG